LFDGKEAALRPAGSKAPKWVLAAAPAAHMTAQPTGAACRPPALHPPDQRLLDAYSLTVVGGC
jgi:hypothetical protein